MELIIVTGLSGGGKTQALRCLEDMGYFTICRAQWWADLCSFAAIQSRPLKRPPWL